MRVLLIAALLAVTGCGGPAVDTTPAGPADLSATDQAFVDLVIPQNETALAALTLTADRSPALRPVATQAEAVYRAELAQIRELLATTGRQESALHEGHDMPGMITEAELAAVGHDRGAALDQQLKVLLRTQFEEARTVARAELSAGTSKPVLELSARIDSTRAEFLALLGNAQQ